MTGIHTPTWVAHTAAIYSVSVPSLVPGTRTPVQSADGQAHETPTSQRPCSQGRPREPALATRCSPAKNTDIVGTALPLGKGGDRHLVATSSGP